MVTNAQLLLQCRCLDMYLTKFPFICHLPLNRANSADNDTGGVGPAFCDDCYPGGTWASEFSLLEVLSDAVMHPNPNVRMLPPTPFPKPAFCYSQIQAKLIFTTHLFQLLSKEPSPEPGSPETYGDFDYQVKLFSADLLHVPLCLALQCYNISFCPDSSCVRSPGSITFWARRRTRRRTWASAVRTWNIRWVHPNHNQNQSKLGPGLLGGFPLFFCFFFLKRNFKMCKDILIGG